MESIAVIGGLGTLSGGDLFFKLLKNSHVLKNQLDYQFIFEQKPYTQINLPLYREEDIKSRKFYTYNVCKNFEERNVSKILLPCFACHSFLSELQKEIKISIVNIFDALLNYVKKTVKKESKIGIITSSYVTHTGMFDEFFKDYELIYPDNQQSVMEVIYGENGIKNGYSGGIEFEKLVNICNDLVDKGCITIIPGFTEISLVTEKLRRRGISIVDVNQIYADFAVEVSSSTPEKNFKLGILGGVGPSATIDFMNKIVENTPASRDQEHIKMIVEQNPQIPDRTANILYNESNPTIAMYSTCKQLEAEGADLIAIPCNTAHAFTDCIQEYLKIPIVNMLQTTADYISANYSGDLKIGLLATTGTIKSEVYHKVLQESGFTVIVPDETHQQMVMDSIYGEYGVKAGVVTSKAKNDAVKAIEYLISLNADIIILGCTELPLLFKDESEIIVNEKVRPLIDPTLVLAKKIVELSKK